MLARVPLLQHPEGNEQVRAKAKHRAKLLAFLNVLMRLRVGRPMLKVRDGAPSDGRGATRGGAGGAQRAV